MKRAASRRGKRPGNQASPFVLATVAAAVLLVVGWWYWSSLGGARDSVEIQHVHGLGFSSQGRQLFVAAHDGFRIFADGQWVVPDLAAHDFMGFAATDNGFYSSGHPHPSANRVNPLGLVKSTDDGQTLLPLGFEGESDFHLMGVGYQNHAIYVLNPAPNSKLPPGVHYSLDDGETWQQTALQGVTAEPIQIAVHPTEAHVVALATGEGLFLSSDYGNTFERLGEREPITAAAFSPDGDRLFFGYVQLRVYELASQEVSTLQTPASARQDAIGYIAIHPAQPSRIAFATFGRDIFLSEDGGLAWQQIAQGGRGRRVAG